MIKKEQRGFMKNKCLKIIFYVIFSMVLTQNINANPFIINFPSKEYISNEDYICVQTLLRSIDILPLMNELYYQDVRDRYSFHQYLGRCTCGLRLNLIDPVNGLFPQCNLVKIGQGSDRCIVCYATFNSNYPFCLKSLPEALERVGFNGYFYYRLGGFPNPSGNEIQYAGVPYCFKIFMMLEAKKLGFEKVLWLDSALLPLKDPTPFFNKIEQTGACWSLVNHYPESKKFILKSTEDIMKSLTGIDIIQRAEHSYAWGTLLGLDLSTEKAMKFIDKFYQFVELGTPFLNGSPDEIVYTGILGMPEFRSWTSHGLPVTGVFQGSTLKERILKCKAAGYYFYYRVHDELLENKEYEDVFNSIYPK